MAEFINAFGKIRGKFGNVIGYIRADGKNFCKSTCLKRAPSGEKQKCRSVEFSTIAHMKRGLGQVIKLGFPGGKNYPKGYNGFASANGTGVLIVEKIDPEKPISKRKKAAKEFRGIVDYGKLRVAAGTLVSPEASVVVDAGKREVTFTHPGIFMNSIDCFLDDKIYGVILFGTRCSNHVVELGTRGETTTRSVELKKEINPDNIAVYLFATSANGQEASDSVCLREPLKQG